MNGSSAEGPNKNQQAHSRIVLPILTALLAIVWIGFGLARYGWWAEGRPQSGFFPTLVGAVLLLVSVLAIFREIKEDPPSFMKIHTIPVLAAVSMVLISLVIGFFPALIIYVYGWLRWIEKYPLRMSISTTLVVGAAMYGIFRLWLRVPFPTGLLFRLF